ncbi:TonB-dependent siderophore receptor [Brytella acorum]|uniref:TonB-dependent siderophore receptor n=1 Tax=Brytella acorum TaxID=2959299 RepID=UPI0025ADBDBC|nr:TonB-dependent siderophore receptor [Brytella acorum]MDF3625961.1 TonB-dependent siderophore receptor [Brytella acorum]
MPLDASAPIRNAGRRRGQCHAWLRRPVILAVPSAVLFSLAAASPASAQGSASQATAATSASARSYSIPALPLGQALAAFGRQGGIQVTYDPSLISGKAAPAISGSMSRPVALQRLLSTSGLSWRQSGADTIVIQKASAAITLGPVRVGGTVARQDPTGPGVGYVAENTVSATKTDTPLTEIPNSIYVVTKQQIVDQQPQSISEALRYTPGVSSEERNPAASNSPAFGIYQRGFSTTEFIDGLNSYGASLTDTAFIERLEAVNGPASVMYGQVYPGGMINATLKKPTNTPFHEISLGFGNWGRYEATADVSDKITKSGNVRYRIAAIGVTQGTQTKYVDYHRVGVLPSITWDIDRKTSLTLLGSYVYTPDIGVNEGNQLPVRGTIITNGYNRIPRSNFVGSPDWNQGRSTEAMFEYQFNHAFNKYIKFEQIFRWVESQSTIKYSYYDYTPDISNPNLVALDPYYHRDRYNTATLDSRISGKINTGSVSHTWVIGSDFRNVNYKLDAFGSNDDLLVNVYDPQATPFNICMDTNPRAGCITSTIHTNYNYFQEGVYFQDQIRWKGLSIILGGRQDWLNDSRDLRRNSTSGGVQTVTRTVTSKLSTPRAFTWRAGLVYELPFGLAPYFSYATSFVPQDSTDWQGKPQAPLTGDQLEAGLKYKVPNRDILITASAFRINENHYLINDLVHSGYTTDGGRVRSQGFEVSANGNITRDLRLIASYSFTDARFAKNNYTDQKYNPVTGTYYGSALPEQGHSVPQVPRNMFSIFADYTLPRKIASGFGINWGMRYVGFTFPDNVESYKVPSHMLFDIGAHYDFGTAFPMLRGLRAQLAVSNLTNKYYVTACATATCYLGQGRKVYGNLTYNW